MSKNTTTDSFPAGDPALFDYTELAEPHLARRPITELNAIHKRGVELLRPYTDDPEAIIRVRAADTVGWDDVERRHQVTVRRLTPSGNMSNEWLGLTDGHIRHLVYGWLNGDTIEQVLVLDGQRLIEDIVDRPGCLVPPLAGKGILHHAPGGAGFLVVDVRRIPELTVVKGHGAVTWSTLPAEVAYQPPMF